MCWIKINAERILLIIRENYLVYTEKYFTAKKSDYFI